MGKQITIPLDDPDLWVIERDRGCPTLFAYRGKVYERGVSRVTAAFGADKPIVIRDSPLPELEARWVVIKAGVPDVTFADIFGHPPTQPFPVEKLIDGVRYVTANYELVCRYRRSVRTYEPDYRKFREHGPEYIHYVGELLRTPKGRWVTIEETMYARTALGPMLRIPPEADIREIIERHAPDRYPEFFDVEEA